MCSALMKKSLLFLLILMLTVPLFAQNLSEDTLEQLSQTITKKQDFDGHKLKRISRLEQALNKDLSPAEKYKLFSMLYHEYKSFNYDKAFFFSQKMQATGRLLNDPVKISDGKIKFGFILLSSGMFKETFDSLNTVDVKILPDSLKQEYYFLTARTYYDLADYDKDKYYAPIYNKRAGIYIDSAIALSSPQSYNYTYNLGLKYLKLGKRDQAAVLLKKLMKDYPLTDHELAVTASTLSDIYIQNGENDEAIKLLEMAAIADIKSSTKEAAAMLNLAQLLHKKGDIKNAYVYINEAMNDASYYGARQRKMQVSQILMVIAGKKINSVEEQRRILFIYASLLTLLAAIVILFAFIISRQLKKLRKADKIIVNTNISLQQTIDKLNEADKIKEEYIGYYFNLISEYITKLDRFKRSVNNKLVTKKFEDIQMLVNNINLKKEKEELFVNFDKAFLTLFPNFVEAFNSLFAAEHQVKLNAGQLLNTDLRIFALIRLGISDTEKIASILEYSMNTIYNYKARIKSKSLIPNDDFEDTILSMNTI
jgi:tetratricopeptide (TPR) repeat protein